MAEIVDITARRACLIAQDFLAAYQRQRDAMRIVGVPSADLATRDDGEIIVADVAACMTVATFLPRVTLSAAVLDRMQTVEEAAYLILSRAADAYFGSSQLRAELGRIAEEPFRQLREAMPGAA